MLCYYHNLQKQPIRTGHDVTIKKIITIKKEF